MPGQKQLTFPVVGMTCANCAANIERSLKKVEGVIEASVNYANEKASITYSAGTVTRAHLAAAVRKAGYDVVETPADKDGEDAETAARKAEVRHQWKRFIVGLCFSLPLFLMSMSRDFHLLGNWAHAAWVNWLFWVLATPVQFYVGRDYYVGGWRSLRSGSANMDVLVAMGSSVAYFYSITVLAARTFGSDALGQHVYFETSAVIITLIVLGKLLEARAKGHTSEAICHWRGFPGAGHLAAQWGRFCTGTYPVNRRTCYCLPLCHGFGHSHFNHGQYLLPDPLCLVYYEQMAAKFCFSSHDFTLDIFAVMVGSVSHCINDCKL